MWTAHPDITFHTVLDESYPVRVRTAYDRPPFLFGRGVLPKAECVSIVGSRTASKLGLEIADALAGELARQGYCIVSGLAEGVDTAAHRGALAAGGQSIAVIAHALDVPTFPQVNARLAVELAGSGGVISQFRPGSPVTDSSFLARNTIISAASAITIVIEPGERSGTRSTLESALRQGRAVVVVDPDIDQVTWAKQLQAETSSIAFAEDISQALRFVDSIVGGVSVS